MADAVAREREVAGGDRDLFIVDRVGGFEGIRGDEVHLALAGVVAGQEIVHREIGDLPADDIRRITWANAAGLYRHPVPAAVQDDPEVF